MAWTTTRFSNLIGVDYPIIQGPFGGGFSTAELTAAASNAGGLGSYGAAQLAPEDILKRAADIRGRTSKPFALNLWVSTADPGAERYTVEDLRVARRSLDRYRSELGLEWSEPKLGAIRSFEDQAAAVIEARPAAFSFVFGVPSQDILRACRENGILTIGAATTVDEAEALEAAGVDAVVASGFEAGGHRPSFLRPAEDSLVGTFALTPQVADRVAIPAIAAGGIADGRGVAAALTLGAAAAQLGTAFLATEESGASDLHRRMLFSKDSQRTVLSRAYSGRLARGISNRIHDELSLKPDQLAPYPVQGWLTGELRGAATEQNRPDLVSLWSGQSAPLIRQRRAGALVESLVSEADRVLGPRAS